jgi:signal transduction histidine kinase
MWRRSLLAQTAGSHLLAVSVALLLASTTVFLIVARSERTRLIDQLEARAGVYAAYAGELASSTTILEGLAAAVVRRFPPEPGTAVRVFAPNGSLLTPDSELGVFPSRAVHPHISGPIPFLPLAPDTRVTVAQPINHGSETIGIVEVSSNGIEAVRLRRTLLLALLPAAVLALGSGMLLALLLARNLLRPLATLQHATALIAAGDFNARADERRPDEIGQLAAEVNRMAAELEARFAEVQHLANARRDFYRSVSHDLRTPLTAIRGIAENLEDSLPQEDRSSLLIIQAETERLGRLVDEILAGGERPFIAQRQSERLTAAPLVREVVDLMCPRAERGGVQLHFEQRVEGLLLGDRDRLKQALINVLDNALKWTLPGGEIRVTLDHQPHSASLIITISDDGPGIPPELRPLLWQRGAHGPDGGQGLGLALVHEVITAHGGTTYLRDGPGTIIELRLPALAASTSAG